MIKTIFLSEKTEYEHAVTVLDKYLYQIRDESPEFIDKYNRSKSSIKELILKAQKFTDSNSTLHLERKIDFDKVIILLSLTTPNKDSFFTHLKKILSIK